MTMMSKITLKFVLLKAVRRLRREMEMAGVENLRALAEANRSIIDVYLQGCSSKKRASIRSDLNTLLQMGITPEILLNALIGQMPELKPIMEGKDKYRRDEIARLATFLKEG